MNFQLTIICLAFFVCFAFADRSEWLLQREKETKESVGWDDETLDKWKTTLNYLEQLASYKFTGQNTVASEQAELIEGDPDNPDQVVANWYEGDIVLTSQQMDEVVKSAEEDTFGTGQDVPDFDDNELKRAARQKRKLMTSQDGARRWPTTKPINYRLDTTTGVDPIAVFNGVSMMQDLTCLRFNRIANPEGDYIEFYKGTGCSSNLGRVGGKQRISIASGCRSIGIVTHEIGHALGFYHEQARPDRDNYVKINDDNIQWGRKGNFFKRSYSDVTLMGIPYDYGSVMHYGPRAFSTNSENTVDTLDPNAKNTIGQRNMGLSFYDVKTLNNAYCSEVCNRQLPCEHNGYTDPKNCAACRCPDGFSGQLCQNAARTDSSCGQIEHKVGSQPITLAASGAGRCNWLLKTDPGRSLIFTVTSFTFTRATTCTRNYLEIKSEADLATTGARMCSSQPNAVIKSVSNEAMVIYVGSVAFNKLQVTVTATGNDPDATTTVPHTTIYISPTPSSTTTTTTTTESTPAPPSQWNQWGSWTQCTNSCGACGMSIRRRQCQGSGCQGSFFQAERCAFTLCPGALSCCSPFYEGQNGQCTKTGQKASTTTTTITPPTTTTTTSPSTTTSTTTTVQPTVPTKTTKDPFLRRTSTAKPVTDRCQKWSAWSRCQGFAQCGGCGLEWRARVCWSNGKSKSETESKPCGFNVCTNSFQQCCKGLVPKNGVCVQP